MDAAAIIAHRPILICDACCRSANIRAALFRSPFISDADPCYLSCSIILCANPWFPLLLCATLYYSVTLYNSWHLSMPPVLLCASPCCSFKIWALCHSSTPTFFPIILRSCWCWNYKLTHPSLGYLTTHTSTQPSPPYQTPQLRHQKWYCLIKTAQETTSTDKRTRFSSSKPLHVCLGIQSVPSTTVNLLP